MMRLPLLAKCALRTIPNQSFSPALRPLATSAALMNANKPISPSAVHFKLERQVFIASLPLVPLSYFIHGTAMDWLLAGAIIANCHFGGHAVITDYARPIVIGENLAKLSHYAAYLGTVLIAIGLIHFNVSDVGLTKAFEMVFAM